jgi:GNAT superfamily N-acetyltransferase
MPPEALVTEIITTASTPVAYEAFGTLIREYVEWCRARYVDKPWIVDMAFGQQALEKELADLATAYAAPYGNILLAQRDGEVTGGIAYRTLAPGICEMKRLFVREGSKGGGTGRRLCEALIAHALTDGFHLMRLDTGVLFHEAQKLYRSLGFVECEPFNEYPERVRPLIVYMEMRLVGDAG